MVGGQTGSDHGSEGLADTRRQHGNHLFEADGSGGSGRSRGRSGLELLPLLQFSYGHNARNVNWARQQISTSCGESRGYAFESAYAKRQVPQAAQDAARKALGTAPTEAKLVSGTNPQEFAVPWCRAAPSKPARNCSRPARSRVLPRSRQQITLVNSRRRRLYPFDASMTHQPWGSRLPCTTWHVPSAELVLPGTKCVQRSHSSCPLGWP